MPPSTPRIRVWLHTVVTERATPRDPRAVKEQEGVQNEGRGGEDEGIQREREEDGDRNTCSVFLPCYWLFCCWLFVTLLKNSSDIITQPLCSIFALCTSFIPGEYETSVAVRHSAHS